MREDSVPVRLIGGTEQGLNDLASSHEEADLLLTQQAVYIAKRDPAANILVLCDDTDVFALLLYFYWNEKLQSTMRCSRQLRVDIKKRLAYILTLYP